jgi:hypothetical protein
MNLRKSVLPVLSGDVLTLFVVTLAGFASHGLSLVNPRLWTTFLPMVAAWLVYSPWFGVYDPDAWSKPANIWRPALAAALAVPLAVLLRSLWLGSTVIPVFALVMAGVSALGIGLWRAAWALLTK